MSENCIADRVGKKVDSVVVAVENQVHDANLMAMNSFALPIVEMGERLITGLSVHGPNNVDQNPTNFSEKNVLRENGRYSAHAASSRTDIKTNHSKND